MAEGRQYSFRGIYSYYTLVMAAGRCDDIACLKVQVKKVVRGTTVDDAVEFYRAFLEAGVKVNQ